MGTREARTKCLLGAAAARADARRGSDVGGHVLGLCVNLQNVPLLVQSLGFGGAALTGQLPSCIVPICLGPSKAAAEFAAEFVTRCQGQCEYQSSPSAQTSRCVGSVEANDSTDIRIWQGAHVKQVCAHDWPLSRREQRDQVLSLYSRELQAVEISQSSKNRLAPYVMKSELGRWAEASVLGESHEYEDKCKFYEAKLAGLESTEADDASRPGSVLSIHTTKAASAVADSNTPKVQPTSRLYEAIGSDAGGVSTGGSGDRPVEDTGCTLSGIDATHPTGRASNGSELATDTVPKQLPCEADNGDVAFDQGRGCRSPGGSPDDDRGTCGQSAGDQGSSGDAGNGRGQSRSGGCQNTFGQNTSGATVGRSNGGKSGRGQSTGEQSSGCGTVGGRDTTCGTSSGKSVDVPIPCGGTRAGQTIGGHSIGDRNEADARSQALRATLIQLFSDGELGEFGDDFHSVLGEMISTIEDMQARLGAAVTGSRNEMPCTLEPDHKPCEDPS
eukprot:TRINITY_DN102186_c0_g1_i1.p1 TRINITY_DN102186_c0_g1~~TRINITY_DN102186_c0_g1_i1.p1  ORF type:complete len:549 (-),score=83.39 TRINITY_DN102186_c0_g1_i1:391-1893(-)